MKKKSHTVTDMKKSDKDKHPMTNRNEISEQEKHAQITLLDKLC